LATEADKVLAYQLTENLLREDLNPIDQAQVYSPIFRQNPDKGYEVAAIMGELVNYKLRPNDVSDQFAPTVGAIIDLTGKSITTLYNTLSLLLNPSRVQSAIIDALYLVTRLSVRCQP